jgi:hypothetical protein
MGERTSGFDHLQALGCQRRVLLPTPFPPNQGTGRQGGAVAVDAGLFGQEGSHGIEGSTVSLPGGHQD